MEKGRVVKKKVYKERGKRYSRCKLCLWLLARRVKVYKTESILLINQSIFRVVVSPQA